MNDIDDIGMYLIPPQRPVDDKGNPLGITTKEISDKYKCVENTARRALKRRNDLIPVTMLNGTTRCFVWLDKETVDANEHYKAWVKED